MENMNESFLLAKVLMTITTIIFGIVPCFADFNKTHATNPLWTGHARFHVVWQCVSYLGMGLFSFYLTWVYKGDTQTALNIAMLLGLFVFVSFYITLMAMPLFGGEPYDVNGYTPIPVNIFGLTIMIERNFTAFTIGMIFLIATFIANNF